MERRGPVVQHNVTVPSQVAVFLEEARGLLGIRVPRAHFHNLQI
jgi:hypothetical protein